MGDAEQRNSKNQDDLIARAILENFSNYGKNGSSNISNDRTCAARSKASLDKSISCFSDWSPRSKCGLGNQMQSRTNISCTTGSHYMLGDPRPPSASANHASVLRTRQSSCFGGLSPDDSRFSVSANDLASRPVFEDRSQMCCGTQGPMPRVRANQCGVSQCKESSDDCRYTEDDECGFGSTRKADNFGCEMDSDNAAFSSFRTFPGKQMRSPREDSQRPEYYGKQNGKNSPLESYLIQARDSMRRPTDHFTLNGGDSMSPSVPFRHNGKDSGFPSDSFGPIGADFTTDASYFAPGSLRSNGGAYDIPADDFGPGQSSQFCSDPCGPKAESRPICPDFCKPNGDTSRYRSDDFGLNGEDSTRFQLDADRQPEGGSQFGPNSFRSNGGYSSFARETNQSASETSQSFYDPCKPNDSSYDPCKPNDSSYDPCKPNGSSYDPCKPNTSSYDPCKPNTSSYDPCKPSTSSYDPCKPNTSSYDPCKPNTSSYDPCKPNGNSSNYSPGSFAPNGEGSPFSPDPFKSADKFATSSFRPNGEGSHFNPASFRSSDNSFCNNGESSNFPVDPCGTVDSCGTVDPCGTADDDNARALDDCCDLKEDWDDSRCMDICGVGMDEWFAVSPSLQGVVAKLASKSVKKGGSVLKDLMRLKAANILPPDFSIPGEEEETGACEGKETEATASQLRLAAEKLVEHIVCRAAKIEAAQNDKSVDLSECDCYLEDVVKNISCIIGQATDQKKTSRSSRASGASDTQRASKASASQRGSKASASQRGSKISESQRASQASSKNSSNSSSQSSSSSSVNSNSNNSACKSYYDLRDDICDALMQNCFALLEMDPSTLEDVEDVPDLRCAWTTLTAGGKTWRNINNSQGGHERTLADKSNTALSDSASAESVDIVKEKVADSRFLEAHGSEQSLEEVEEEGSIDDVEATELDAKGGSHTHNVLTVDGVGHLPKTSSELLPPTTFLELPPEEQKQTERRESMDAAILAMLESCLEDCSKLASNAELRKFVMEVVYSLYSTVRAKLVKILTQQAENAPPESRSQPIDELLGKADQEIRELVLPAVIEHIVWLVRQDAKQRGGQVNREAAKALAGEYVDTIVTNAVLKLETNGKSRRPFAKTFVVTSNDASVKRHGPAKLK